MSKQKSKKLNQYTAVFEPDQEVGGYTVTIPALPGCISEGDNFEEAQQNIKEAARLYIETMRTRREKAPTNNGGVVISPIYLSV